MPVIATVDSGASRCFFPLQIAMRLGLTPGELAQDAGQATGVGSSFNTWSSTLPVRAMVIAYLAVPGQAQLVPQAWGPEIALQPAFAAEQAFLLGRVDFFKAFTVTFEEIGGVPQFHLDAP